MMSNPADRDLYIVPVLHDSVDLGAMSDHVEAAALETLGADARQKHRAAVEWLWGMVRTWADDLPRTLGSYRIYQDGLPVTDHALQIVHDLAAQGSENHRILVELLARGASLEGTEEPELLLAEYRLVTAAAAADDTDPSEQHMRATQGAVLLEQRDAFIARRIEQTLRPGERGILFIGMLHNVEAHLEAGVKVHQPIDWSDPTQGRRA